MKNTEKYIQRRKQLSKTFGRSLFVIPSGDEAKRSHSINFRFKTASDFFYLTGLELSKAVLVITSQKSYLLLEQNQDQLWGEFTSISEQDHSLLSELVMEPLSKLDEILKSHLHEVDRIAASLERSSWVDQLLLSTVSFQRRASGRRSSPLHLTDSRILVGTLRHIKDFDEIQNLRKASQLSSEAHRKLLSLSAVGKTERQICNWIEGEFQHQGMSWTSYETIVGSGERATTLHARASEKIIQEQDLVLIDAGAEWKGYCADITRVFPAGKKFSAEQKEIYSLVLETQKLALKACRPATSLDQIHQVVLQNLREGLSRLGKGEAVTELQIKELFPHSTSHWIGMDVHDPCPYVDDQGNAIQLKEGMSFTVEPGLYFRNKNLFSKYYGIGVRIEDDVLITTSGAEILTSSPKEIEQIEELRGCANP